MASQFQDFDQRHRNLELKLNERLNEIVAAKRDQKGNGIQGTFYDPIATQS
jgi:hypothetical protein